MVGYWDKDQRNQYGNTAYASWFGINPAQMLGMHIREVIGEALYHQNLPFIEGVLRGKPQQFERAIPSPDGKQVQYSITEYRPEIVEGEVRGFFVHIADITSIKDAQVALIQSEKKFDTMLQTLVEGLVIVDLEGAISYTNPAAWNILGLGKDEITGKYFQHHDWRQLDLNGEIYPREQLPLAIALRERRIVRNVVHAIVQNDECKWLRVNAAPLFDDNGNLTGALASFHDITHYKITEDALKDSEGKFRQIAENTSDGIIAFSADNQINYVSPA